MAGCPTYPCHPVTGFEILQKNKKDGLIMRLRFAFSSKSLTHLTKNDVLSHMVLILRQFKREIHSMIELLL